MHDGSRHFASLPQSCAWYAIRDHVDKLDGALLTQFLGDGILEAWVDFAYCEHEFSINDPLAEYWFFVNDPDCPETILRRVVKHFAKLLR